MILKNLPLSFAALALIAAPLQAKDEKACTDVAKATTEAVTAAPDNVLKIVSESVAANPKCACDIIGAAVIASKADAALRKQIIEAAATSAPGEVEAIIACTKSPDVFGGDVGKEPVGKGPVGKEPVGKNPPPPPPDPQDPWLDTIDFGLFRAGIGGVYLGSPSSGGSVRIIETETEQPPPVIIVKRPVIIVSPVGP